MNSKASQDNLPGGYMGQVLHVDLSTRSVSCQPLPAEMASLFCGGRGLGAALLCRHYSNLTESNRYENAYSDVDPLSADNIVVISTSPATGTPMPTSGRIHMNFKSPLTGGIGSTNGGGRWGVEFKRCGFDALIISGTATAPVYLVIRPGGAELVDAAFLASSDSEATREAVRASLSRKTAAVLAIGLAGKNRCRFAAVMSDTGKALGRGGGGAVWGAKNLYAVVALGDSAVTVPVHDAAAFDKSNEAGAMYHAKLKLDVGKFTRREEAYGILPSLGSLGLLGMVNNYRQLIHNNMRDTDHRPEHIERITGEALRNHERNAKPGEKRIEVKKGACFNCPIVCKRETTIKDDSGNVLARGEGPEFESVALLGANLSIYDLTTITEANYLANRYGLDTISLGATIAALFDLYSACAGAKSPSVQERQLLDDCESFRNEFGVPEFGKPELLLPLIHQIGQRRGIGQHLAEGSWRFCSRYGHPEFSMTVKKMELPAYDPRASFSQALCYEMNNRGGCHLQGGYTAPHAYCAGYSEWPAHRLDGTPLIAKNAALNNTTLDIIGVCAYGSFSLGLDEYAIMLNAVTGGTANSGTLKTLARRVITLERMFNYLAGFSAAEDWLPERFYCEPLTTDADSVVCDRHAFRKMHAEFYAAFSWDEWGRPETETLRQLGLLPLLPADLEL
jgi:aldehyde:ferredoxin oxidoreductase